MLKKLKSSIILFVIIFIFSSLNIMNVSADTATANVSIASKTVNAGETVTVNIRVSSSVDIGIMEFYLTYDPNILEYKSGATGGGSGELRFFYDVTTKDVTFNVVFTAKTAGSSVIKYKDEQPAGCGIMPLSETYDDYMTISGGTGTVTVVAPSSASSNANLSALKVSSQTESGATKTLTLSPVFSADVNKYYLTLEEDVVKLVVSATAKDSKAKTTVSGTTISPGNNVTTVTVTAENGGTKKYYIYSSQGAAGIDVNNEGLTVQIGDVTMEVLTSLEGVDLPDGFAKTVIGYNSINVEAAYNETKGLNLLYLASSDGTSAGFYIYNVEDGSLYKYQTIVVGSSTYVLIKVDDTVAIPETFKRTSLTINGQEVDGWISDNTQEFGLVYAMNASGEINLYMYDFKEGTMQRMNQNLFMSLSSQELEELESSEIKANDMKNRFLWIILGLITALIAVFVLFMIKIVESKKLSENKEITDEYEEIPVVAELEETVSEPIVEVYEEKDKVYETNDGEGFKEELEEYRVTFKDEEIFYETEDEEIETQEEEIPDEEYEEETTSFEDMRSRVFEGFDDEDDDIEVIDLDDED